MKFFYLLFLTACICQGTSHMLAQPSDQSMRAFVNGPANMRGLEQGRGYYVQNAHESVPKELLFDQAEMVEGIAITTDGQRVRMQGRYIRPTGEIEILLARSRYLLDGSVFDYVIIDGQHYQFIDFAGEVGPRYARVVAGTYEQPFRLVRTYAISVPSHRSPERGITKSSAPRIIADSTSYVVGLKAAPVEVVRKAKRFVEFLTTCEHTAFQQSVAVHKYKSDEQLSGFLHLLNDACPTEE